MSKESYLPTLEAVNQPLSAAELEVLRKKYREEGQYVSLQTRFNYAWGLIRSARVPDQQEGVRMLTELFKDAPQRRREVLYYLSIGSFKLGDYTNARKYCDILLEIEPNNHQVIGLRQAIEDKLSREGLVGIAIVGGLVALGAAIVGSVMRHRR
ncbi:mitochondrial fission 1 protein [Trichomonascus vanleenenianus]|uniref:Fis1p n=1 Tax=Trichomonascus vanleenenianus TaxID=2268995 RepID=UPI003ECACC8C